MRPTMTEQDYTPTELDMRAAWKAFRLEYGRFGRRFYGRGAEINAEFDRYLASRTERPALTPGTPDWRAIARDLALAEAAAIARDVRRRELDLHQCSFDEMPEANRFFVHGADRAAEYIEAAIPTESAAPTREQIGKAVRAGVVVRNHPNVLDDITDAVLALLQKGADQ